MLLELVVDELQKDYASPTAPCRVTPTRGPWARLRWPSALPIRRPGITDPLVGRVQLAPRRVAGPIGIDLNADGVPGPDASGCSVISAEVAAAFTSDPGAYYLNLHNAGSRPRHQRSAQVADVGFISLRELIVLRSDVTAA
jgi:hypothetical protein